MSTLSARLAAVADALPLESGLRVLEVGGDSGALAREIAARIGTGHILMIDRSASRVALARKASATQIEAGSMSVRRADAENFELESGEPPFDLAVAVRVGALDGRHRQAGALAIQCIANALTPGGRLFIDGGNPLRQLALPPQTF